MTKDMLTGFNHIEYGDIRRQVAKLESEIGSLRYDIPDYRVPTIIRGLKKISTYRSFLLHVTTPDHKFEWQLGLEFQIEQCEILILTLPSHGREEVAVYTKGKIDIQKIRKLIMMLTLNLQITPFLEKKRQLQDALQQVENKIRPLQEEIDTLTEELA